MNLSRHANRPAAERWLLLTRLVLALALACGWGPARPAAALPSTLLVGIGGSPCAYATLAEALAAASSGDTLYLAPATYNEVLGTLDRNLHFTAATADCTAADPTAANFDHVIDGGGAVGTNGGLVNIAAGRTVTFTRMILRNAQAANGGLVYLAGGATASFNVVRLQDGIALNRGGLVYVASGASLSVSTTSFLENGQAGLAGGGLYAEGQVTLTSTTIRGSNAPQGGGAALAGAGRLRLSLSHIGDGLGPNQAAAGGGVSLAGEAQLELAPGSSVRWNTATVGAGGGVYAIDAAVVELYGSSRIYGNEAASNGGGVYLGDSAGLTMQDFSQVGDSNPANGNSAERGGGLYAEGTLTVTVRGQAAVRHNFAGAGGGGIYLADGASLDMQGGAIQANTTTGWGGGLALEQGEAALLEAVVSANEALDGGGIALAGDPDNFVDATNTQIISNTASLNGGGVHTVLANVVLYDTNGSSRLSGNQSGGDGGAVWNQGATVTVAAQQPGTQILVQTNTANGAGGAFYSHADGNVFVAGAVTLAGNIALADGGAWYQSGGVALLSVSSFGQTPAVQGNTSLNGHGGGLYLHDVSSQPGSLGSAVTNAEVSGNQADQDGGGLYLSGGTYLRLLNSRVSHNQAGLDGGGVLVSASRLSISSDVEYCQNAVLPADHYCSELRGNGATNNGGAIRLEGAAQVAITSTALISNTAGLGSAVMSASNGDQLDITNSLITHNTGKALYLANAAQLDLVQTTLAANDWALDVNSALAAVDMQNNLIWGNGYGVETSAPLVVGCSLSQNGVGGANTDPLFQTTGRGAFRLASGSPAIDACAQGVAADLDDVSRPQGVNYDMGAFETGRPLILFQPAQSVPEGDAGLAPAAFTVALSETSPQTVTVELQAVEGSAVAGVDYTLPNQTVIFPPGVISQTISLGVLGDTLYEHDETFELHFSSAVGAALTAAVAEITILNDETLPVLAVGPASVAEGNSGSHVFSVPVTLSHASAFTLTVNYDFEGETADPGVDFVAAGGTLVIPPGAVSAGIDITILGDTVAEPDEQLWVALYNVVGAVLAPGGNGAWITLLDDDGAAPYTLYLPFISR